MAQSRCLASVFPHFHTNLLISAKHLTHSFAVSQLLCQKSKLQIAEHDRSRGWTISTEWYPTRSGLPRIADAAAASAN